MSGSAALKPQEDRNDYTYADYLAWDEEVRAEIIYGTAYMMAPPITVHQRILMHLSHKFYNYLEGKTCEVFVAPFGVRLFPKPDRSDDTVVEPDILVVCDPAKIDERGCNGAPDLVIEILSPSNSSMEKLRKFNLYLKAKVREYWVVSPDEKYIEVHIYKDGHYLTKSYGINEPGINENERAEEIIPVSVLPGLTIDLKNIFK
ncbi:MAG: Uma2 family endonuclease [Treponema sp.]|nr:Uma2 family endonuclease [Treponema sp.]